MKRARTLWILLLVLVMLVSVGTGCTKETGTEVEEEAPKTEVESNNETEETPEDQEVLEPINITWFIDCEWYHKTWNATDCAVDKMITDATGITIDFSSGKSEKLSALIASEELSDVITAGKNSPQALLLQEEGMVHPLDELIAQYAPDFNVPESMQKWHGFNGHFYGIVNFFYAPEKLRDGDALPTHTTMLARQDLMKQLGIKPEDFNTKEGTLAALKKVKDANIEFNGFTVQPAYFRYDQLKQMFGARREDESGNYVDRDHEPEALEALKYLNLLYREGVLPEENLTLNDQQIGQKIGQGSVFSFNYSVLQNNQVAPLFDLDEEAYFVEVGPVLGDAGKQPYFDPSPMAGWLTTMINKDTQYPDRIIKLFEYCYNDDERHLELLYGPKGICWDYDDQGLIKLYDDVKKEMDADFEGAKLKYGQDTIIMFYDWIPVMRTLPAPTTIAEEAGRKADYYFRAYSYPDLAFSKGTPPSGTDLAAVRTRIKEYRKKMYPKMIMASSEEEVERLFNEMIAHEKELGYDELFAYASKMFKESKEKLGIEFAWPANQ